MEPSIATRLTFGLVASSSSVETIARFDALARWMRDNAKIDLVSRAAPSYKELAASVREGTSDVAWLPPVVHAWIAEGVTPLGSIVRDGATSYSAALVVREDSPLRALSDLKLPDAKKGVRAGWVDPWSAAGFVVPRLELAQAGIEPSAAFTSETFLGSHREAVLALQRGDCDVVGTYARSPREGEAAQGAWSELEDVRVRVLATFGSIPTDVIAVRRNLAPREHEHALRAFQSACGNADARPLVRAVFNGDELREGLEPGHDALRLAYERGIANGLFD